MIGNPIVMKLLGVNTVLVKPKLDKNPKDESQITDGSRRTTVSDHRRNGPLTTIGTVKNRSLDRFCQGSTSAERRINSR